MTCEISLNSVADLAIYRNIPISFWVTSKLRVEIANRGLEGIRLPEETVSPPYLKDYDVVENVLDWPNHWDISNWAIFLAQSNNNVLGGAVVAWNTPGVAMLEGQVDVAALWDIRIDTQYRGQGIGSALFQQAVKWAAAQGCSRLKIETQNINVPACRFYAKQGCTLSAINLHAYPNLPSEVQLIWSKTIT
jgi:ribosomal protein S18 acetylase RimI-like enzyme